MVGPEVSWPRLLAKPTVIRIVVVANANADEETHYPCAKGIKFRRICCGEHRQVHLTSFFRNLLQRQHLKFIVVASLSLLGIGLAALIVVRILEAYSLMEIMIVSVLGIVVLSVILLRERSLFSLGSFDTNLRRTSQQIVRILCLSILFPVFSIYFLTGGEVGSTPVTLEVGVIGIAATLGGLVLNAGVNLCGEKGREFILVAQKFIAVVILMLMFLPAFHIVSLLGGIDINSFEPGDLTAWGRGVMFWISAASFTVGVGLFVIALVDLVYAMFGLGGTGNASGRKCESPDRKNQSDGCEGASDSASGQPLEC